MNRKNIVFIMLLLACMPTLSMANWEKDVTPWKCGTFISGVASFVGVGGCIYNVLKLKAIKETLQTLDLTEEEQRECFKRLQGYKNWAWGFGAFGAAGLIGTGICGYQWYKINKTDVSNNQQQERLLDGSQNDRSQDNNLIIPLVPQTIDVDENDQLSKEEIKLVRTLAYANSATNDNVQPDYESIKNHMLNDIPDNRQGQYSSEIGAEFGRTYHGSEYAIRDMRKTRGDGDEYVNNLIDKKVSLANCLLARAAEFLGHYRINAEQALRQNEGNFFEQNTTVEQRAKIVRFAREQNNSSNKHFSGCGRIPLRMQDI